MRSKCQALVGAAMVFSSAHLAAADLSAAATRDARRLVDCMKAFDAACANSLTYTKNLEAQGMAREQLDRLVAKLYQEMKSVHAQYSRFELGTAGQPFVIREKTYIFIPYDMDLMSDGRDTSLKAFFVGVSEDFGDSWKFFDGQRLTQDNVGVIIPGYQGGPLPEVARSPAAAQ